MVLTTDRADLWLARPEAAHDPGLVRAYEALMAPEEREQRDRFRFAAHRHSYLVTRALVRTVLSRYADVDPAAWDFVRNAYGRPEIAGPAGVPHLRFNLSHTAGLVACLVTLEHEVGVDVEQAERGGDLLKIAERFFSPREAAELRGQPQGRQRDRFLEYWTLKESYIKARGLGLSLPLQRFSFELEGGIRIRFDPELPDDPRSWQFALLRPGPRHVLAASIRRPPGADVKIETRETLPLRGA